MDDNKKQGWYCANCAMGVPSTEVTFDETHTVCGRVITDDMPPHKTAEDIHVGMPLRDWFAGQALIATAKLNFTYSFEAVAKDAYAIADAMLKVRNAKS